MYTGNAYSCGTLFKITPSGTLTTLHDFNSIDGFLGNTDGVGAGFGTRHRRQLLRNLSFGRLQPRLRQWHGGRLWHGIQNHAGRHLHPALQLLLSTELHRRFLPSDYSCARHGWEPLWDDGIWWVWQLLWCFSGRLWHGLQNHPNRHPDHAVQLLLPRRRSVSRRCLPATEIVASHQTGTSTAQVMGANLVGFYGTLFQITPGGTLTTLYKLCSQPNCALMVVILLEG